MQLIYLIACSGLSTFIWFQFKFSNLELVENSLTFVSHEDMIPHLSRMISDVLLREIQQQEYVGIPDIVTISIIRRHSLRNLLYPHPTISNMTLVRKVGHQKRQKK